MSTFQKLLTKHKVNLSDANYCQNLLEDLMGSINCTMVQCGLVYLERPRRIFVVDEEWSCQNGMLTPTMKLKRQLIKIKYHKFIADMFESCMCKY